ncbi:MAG: trypsin-like peptidase domain-containing protein [Verrucomicrobia bacterium]|nr:trypsin-like peptidase domain-containing protein [Verrucomicrobiota bacterium]
MLPLFSLPRRLTPALFVCAVSAAAFAQDGGAAVDAKKDGNSSALENTVVKVFATSRLPDLYRPWTKQSPRESTGTGVIIEGKRILTNAHVVLYASQVQVQANQSGDKISATVEAISPGIDLAVLKLDDESFFDARPPLARTNTIPEIKDTVLAFGYPTGGTSLSITKGIVSRIEFAGFNYGVSGLRIQIDAAINPGNSGGPAVVGDKMIGLAFSTLGGAQNIGYIIPNEEVELFLKDVADGRYDGKPAMFDSLQTFQNPALRPYLKTEKAIEGMIVTRTDDTAATYPLKAWDVITRIGDTPIDNEGMVKISANLRVSFKYQIQKVARGGKVPLTVVRDGRPLKLELPVAPRRPLLMSWLEGGYPSYFVYGPLVFSNATQDFFSGNDWIAAFARSANPLATRRSDRPAFDGERLVVVSSPFFPHKLSKDYSSPQSWVVQKVNGTAIKNLAHLVETLRDLKDEFVVFDFVGLANETLVFPRKELLAATEDILTDNGVRSQGSPDTLAIWNGKK